MNTQGSLKTKAEFLDKKLDYSPLLVHLTKDDFDSDGEFIIPAKDVLDMILDEKTLRAYNSLCLFNDGLESVSEYLRKKFRVVCFTETPLDQIDILLQEVQGPRIKLEPYGLVFEKGYIRKQHGNPVFYVAGGLRNAHFNLLWNLYDDAIKTRCLGHEDKLLALVNKCDESFDFHWEREWRIVGDFDDFALEDIYCGLCPEDDISYFEKKYTPVKFISPYWGINKILDKLVGRPLE